MGWFSSNDDEPKKSGGPKVKTGPTSGETRSRRSDGGWRRKRSDTGVKRK